MTRKLKTQLDLVREKLLNQFLLVSEKFHAEFSREITNQEIQVALYQYSTSEPSHNEYGEKDLEWLHKRLVKLNKEDMSIITKRFWEAKSYAIIGNELGHPHDPKWAYRRLNEVYNKIRKAGL